MCFCALLTSSHKLPIQDAHFDVSLMYFLFSRISTQTESSERFFCQICINSSRKLYRKHVFPANFFISFDYSARCNQIFAFFPLFFLINLTHKNWFIFSTNNRRNHLEKKLFKISWKAFFLTSVTEYLQSMKVNVLVGLFFSSNFACSQLTQILFWKLFLQFCKI